MAIGQAKLSPRWSVVGNWQVWAELCEYVNVASLSNSHQIKNGPRIDEWSFGGSAKKGNIMQKRWTHEVE
jgi:hypothetical protein